jgi:F-type H+-transporting ATPase subunit a
MFLPMNSPSILAIPFILIETLGFLIRPISLGVRLVANLAAGHLLLTLGSGFIFFYCLVKLF